MDLENTPAFVELAGQAPAQAFFSAVAIRMKEERRPSNQGFQRTMALIDELIHDNHRQLHRINKINARVTGQCLVTSHKLKGRAVFFQGQTKYFKTRGTVALEEKGEAVNVRNNRIAQRKSYKAILVSATARNGRQRRKWGDRVANGHKALNKVNAALRAVNEWKPKTRASFIQESVVEITKLYSKIKKLPLSVPTEMIQLSANDKRLRRRLFEWLNLLKRSILRNLNRCNAALKRINSLHGRLSRNIRRLRRALRRDAKKLVSAIENYTALIKVYSENEKIYQNLYNQNNLLIQANSKWCTVEASNYGLNKNVMEKQLKVFQALRLWLRKNFRRVRQWIGKRYSF